MAKIPVQRTVMRDGKPHLQTYWEESSPKKRVGRGVSLGNLGVSLPNQSAAGKNSDPVREAWNSSTVVSAEAVKRRDPDVEASIAAGLTPEASMYLTSRVIPRGESLADYIYDNGLDQQPRPRDGWKSYGGSDDQRKAWLSASKDGDFSLEQAVEWIDAGFPYPFSGIPMLIKSGVSAARAKEWEPHTQIVYSGSGSVGGYLYLYKDELTSDITLEEAQVWRAALNGQGNQHPLSANDIQYYSLGFAPDEAARWTRVTYASTPPERVAVLKSLGWTPSSIKATLKETDKYSRKVVSLTPQFAEQMIRATPLLGSPKVIKEWIAIAYESFDRELDDHAVVKAIREDEEWKAHAKKVTGVAIKQNDYKKMSSLLPRQREAYLEIMNTEGREGDEPTYRVSRAMDLARTIGSVENMRFLQERGFPLGSTERGVVAAYGHPGGKYDTFDASSASPESQGRWMRSAAAAMYWVNTYDAPVTGDDMKRIIDNPAIDPIKFKDTLLAYGGVIKPVQLEGIVINDVTTAVSDGWL